MKKTIRLLIAEDSEDDVDLVLRELRRAKYDPLVHQVEDSNALGEALKESWDLVISDYHMPTLTAPDVLRMLREHDPDTPFIVVSGTVGEDAAVKMMRLGAQDYCMKGNLQRLVPAVERELKEARSRKEKRKLSEQLLQAQKMEAVGRLAGGVAHDFNNLLSVIIGYSNMALEEIPPGVPLRQYIEEVQKAGERAGVLTRQLLTFSRKGVFQPKRLDLNEIISGVERMLQRLIGERIDFRTRLSVKRPLVKADAGQMEQVLMNLVLNARDAMPKGGSLVIESEIKDLDRPAAREVGEMEPGTYAILAVTDTGTGMSRETRERIFEPFFTTKGEDKGTGLGLATVLEIVKRSNGRIRVESREGQGTTFTVYFPALLEEETAVPEAKLDDAAIRKGAGSILVVDDEESIRMLVETVLRNLGYRVLSSTDAERAEEIATAEAASIDLLLTDVVMPGIGGVELSRRLRRAHPALKVVYMSGYSGDDLAQQGVLAPDVHHLEKPLSPASLGAKIREVMEQNRR